MWHGLAWGRTSGRFSLLQEPPSPLCQWPLCQATLASPKTCQSPFPAFSAVFTVCPDPASWPRYPSNLRPSSPQLYWEVIRGKHPDFCGIPVSLKVERGSLVGSADFLLHLTPHPPPSLRPPHKQVAALLLLAARWGEKRGWPGRPTGGEATSRGGIGRRSSGRRRKWPGCGQQAGAPLRAPLMTCGEATQQPLRSSGGGSRSRCCQHMWRINYPPAHQLCGAERRFVEISYDFAVIRGLIFLDRRGNLD